MPSSFLECEVVEPLSKEALLGCEQLHIDVLEPPYNAKSKAASPYEHHTSEETRALIGAAHRGHHRSPGPRTEHANNLIIEGLKRAHAAGRFKPVKHGPEVRARIAEAARAQHARMTPEERVANGKRLRGGKSTVVSDETRDKLRQANARRYAAMTKEERLAHTAAMRIAANGHA